jgi:hypothetical protein
MIEEMLMDPGDSDQSISMPNILPSETDAGKVKFEPLTRILVGSEYMRFDGIQRSLHSDERFIIQARNPEHFILESGKYDILVIDKISGGYGGKDTDNLLTQLKPNSKVILLSISPEKEPAMPENVVVLNLRDWDRLKNTVAGMEKSIRANRNK